MNTETELVSEFETGSDTSTMSTTTQSQAEAQEALEEALSRCRNTPLEYNKKITHFPTLFAALGGAIIAGLVLRKILFGG